MDSTTAVTSLSLHEFSSYSSDSSNSYSSNSSNSDECNNIKKTKRTVETELDSFGSAYTMADVDDKDYYAIDTKSLTNEQIDNRLSTSMGIVSVECHGKMVDTIEYPVFSPSHDGMVSVTTEHATASADSSEPGPSLIQSSHSTGASRNSIGNDNAYMDRVLLAMSRSMQTVSNHSTKAIPETQPSSQNRNLSSFLSDISKEGDSSNDCSSSSCTDEDGEDDYESSISDYCSTVKDSKLSTSLVQDNFENPVTLTGMQTITKDRNVDDIKECSVHVFKEICDAQTTVENSIVRPILPHVQSNIPANITRFLAIIEQNNEMNQFPKSEKVDEIESESDVSDDDENETSSSSSSCGADQSLLLTPFHQDIALSMQSRQSANEKSAISFGAGQQASTITESHPKTHIVSSVIDQISSPQCEIQTSKISTSEHIDEDQNESDESDDTHDDLPMEVPVTGSFSAIVPVVKSVKCEVNPCNAAEIIQPDTSVHSKILFFQNIIDQGHSQLAEMADDSDCGSNDNGDESGDCDNVSDESDDVDDELLAVLPVTSCSVVPTSVASYTTAQHLDNASQGTELQESDSDDSDDSDESGDSDDESDESDDVDDELLAVLPVTSCSVVPITLVASVCTVQHLHNVSQCTEPQGSDSEDSDASDDSDEDEDDDEYGDLMYEMQNGRAAALVQSKIAPNSNVTKTTPTIICSVHDVKECSQNGLKQSQGPLPEAKDDSDTSGSSSSYDSSSYSSSDEIDEDDYAEYLSKMPKPGAVPMRPPLPPKTAMISTPKKSSCNAGLGVPRQMPSSIPVEEAPLMANPLEGMAMLQSIRADLEKVGRMIVAKKDGQQFLKRAQILASINWLAVNVPTCVLDHLGKEIRGVLNPSGNVDSLQVMLRDDTSVNEWRSIKVDNGVHNDDIDYDFSGHDDIDYANGESIVEFETMPNTSPRKRSPVFNLDALHETRSLKPTFLAEIKPHAVNSVALSVLETKNVPYVSNFRTALLFVDISGFTKLSTEMDPENLSKVINSYFKLLVDKVFQFGGDIQKFVGDAFFAEWRETDTITLTQCVAAATACSCALIRDCCSFPVFDFGSMTGATSDPISTLDCHCGLGFGDMIGIHLGDNDNRREYLYIGDPIDQAADAANRALRCEAVVSDDVKALLTTLDPLWEDYLVKSGRYNLVADASGDKVKLNSKSYLKTTRDAKCRGITEHVDGLQVDCLIEYRRLISLYVHPVVVSNDVAASNNFQSTSVQERRKDEAELRSAYVMFIKPLISMKIKEGKTLCREEALLLNSIMNLMTRELKQYNGHLRQFVVDDKGFVIVATFGLRGSTYPNMVTEKALPATLSIYRGLESELGVVCKIGATIGDVYCGPVGGESRQEFAVVGPSVNLAARLMCSDTNPGILVDNAVRLIASHAFGFTALEPVVAKGYTEPVPIFEPLGSQIRVSGSIASNFSGRQIEIERLIKLSKEMVNSNYNERNKVVMITGMGKSSFLMQAVTKIRNDLDVSVANLVALHSSLPNDCQKPFSAIRAILLKILSSNQGFSEESSCYSRSSRVSRASMAFGYANKVDKGTTSSRISLAVASIVAEQTYPDKVVNLGTEYICGDRTDPMPNIRGKDKCSIMPSVVSFIAHVVLRCIQEEKLVLLALDDMHRTDEFSIQVIQRMLSVARNILFIGVSYAVTMHTMRVSKEFWNKLNSSDSEVGQLITLELGRLSEEDVISLTMKTLGLQRREVTSEILSEVLVQSGGMPRFACKVLEGIKHRTHTRRETVVLGDGSVTEMVLHRIDAFDIALRSVLNVGAVLGSTFSFGELMQVLGQNKDAKEVEIRKEAISSLRTLVKEGILYTGESSECNLDVSLIKDDDFTTFTFYKTVWQTTILGLLLGSRKKDVHKKMANALEASTDDAKSCPTFHKKVFGHWKETGDTTKATAAVLRAGKFFEENPGSIEDSLSMYEDALRMWGWNEHLEASVGGYPQQVLDILDAAELSKIISISVARGRAFKIMKRHKDSIRAFEVSISIKQSAKAAANLPDRSIIFPAFVGIMRAVADGHIYQDVYRRYEQMKIHQFLDETRIHGRLIHHIFALYLQMELYGCQGELDKAIAVQSIIKKLYNADKHTHGLSKIYGVDAGALSCSKCAYFLMLEKKARQGLKMAMTVLKDIIPKVDVSFDGFFSLVFPLVFVLKDAGYVNEARAFFEKIVYIPFKDKVKGIHACVLVINDPLMMLLDLSSTKKAIDKKRFDRCLEWTAKESAVRFEPITNILLGRLGLSGDSISAEICYLLASDLEAGPTRRTLLKLGEKLITGQIIFLRNNGLRASLKHAHLIRSKIDTLSGGEKYERWTQRQDSLSRKSIVDIDLIS